MKIGHIVHLFETEDEEYHSAQSVAVQAMRRARDFAEAEVDVELLCVWKPQDKGATPQGFVATPDLTRSIHDFVACQTPPFPVLRDVVDRLYAASDADLLVYSNSDIAPMPHFYAALAALARDGYDALDIRRRSVPASRGEVTDLPLLYSLIGEGHPGRDCLAFARRLYPDFLMHDGCIGVARAGESLALNMFAAAARYMELTDLHLTFHLGDSQRWRSDPAHHPAVAHNLRELDRTYEALVNRHGDRVGAQRARFRVGLPLQPAPEQTETECRERGKPVPGLPID